MKYARVQEIKQLLLHQGRVSTLELSRRFSVSIETIRRDLDSLEREGFIRKVYGGAEINRIHDPADVMDIWATRCAVSDAEKRLIAARTLDFIPDGSTIVLDSGTTTYRLAGLLRRCANLTVLTNSVYCAMAVSRNSNHTVYLMGGVLKQDELITTGFLAADFLNGFNKIDIAIIGADGFTLEEGVSDYSFEMCMIKQRFLKKSETVIAIGDHTKFGKRANYCSCPLEDIDCLITDPGTDAALLGELALRGIRVVVTEPVEEGKHRVL